MWSDLKRIKVRMMMSGSSVGHGEARGWYFGPQRRNGGESRVVIGCAGEGGGKLDKAMERVGERGKIRV